MTAPALLVDVAAVILGSSWSGRVYCGSTRGLLLASTGRPARCTTGSRSGSGGWSQSLDSILSTTLARKVFSRD
jgi:hypothetical protein